MSESTNNPDEKTYKISEVEFVRTTTTVEVIRVIPASSWTAEEILKNLNSGLASVSANALVVPMRPPREGFRHIGKIVSVSGPKTKSEVGQWRLREFTLTADELAQKKNALVASMAKQREEYEQSVKEATDRFNRQIAEVLISTQEERDNELRAYQNHYDYALHQLERELQEINKLQQS